MRLLLASDSYPPLIGGGTRDTALLATALQRRGHQVEVVTVQQPGLAANEVVDGVTVHRVGGAAARLSRDPHRRHQPPVADPVTVRAVRSVVAGFRPEVVSTYGWLSHSVAAAVGDSAPVALTVRDSSAVCANRTLVQHGDGAPHPCAGPAWGKCLRCTADYYGGPVRATVSVTGVLGGRGRLARRLSGVHWCSSYLRQAVRPHLPLRPDTIEAVVPPFRGTPGDAPDTAALAALPTEPYLLFVGQFRWEKGVRVLLDAWSRLDRRPPLVLIGSAGTDVPDPPPAGVVLLRDVSTATVLAAWDRALFGVAPSVLPEGFGNVVHEAMSRGRPVIGTGPSGMTDIIDDGVDGLVVPRGDAVALREAISRLLDDPALVGRLGEQALVKAQRFTEDVVVPEMERFFRAVGAGPS